MKLQEFFNVNAWCPTGEGGGKDNSCPPNSDGPGSWNAETDSYGSAKEDFENAESPDQIKAMLDHYECAPVESNSMFSLPGVYTTPTMDIVEWDGESNYVSFTDSEDAEQWVHERDTTDEEGEYEEEFHNDFWSAPGPLYHASDSDNAESILKNGIRADSQTRGMSNRNVGDSVYTTAEIEEAWEGSYGDAVFEIDTAAMARDGYKPQVNLEPDEVTGTVKEALASTLGLTDYYYEREQGMSPNTIVLDSSIPAKYVKRVQ